jgi:hypothetical protein
MPIRLTQEEVREFYDHELEPERRRLLGEFQTLVAALSSEGADRALLPQYQKIARELKEVNEQMQRDFWQLRDARERAAKRVEEIRQQMESGALEITATGCR